MKPIGGKGIIYPAYADSYRTASFPFVTFSLDKKSSILKDILALLL